ARDLLGAHQPFANRLPRRPEEDLSGEHCAHRLFHGCGRRSPTEPSLEFIEFSKPDFQLREVAPQEHATIHDAGPCEVTTRRVGGLPETAIGSFKASARCCGIACETTCPEPVLQPRLGLGDALRQTLDRSGQCVRASRSEEVSGARYEQSPCGLCIARYEIELQRRLGLPFRLEHARRRTLTLRQL